MRTRDGTLHPLDVLVLATGFDAHAFVRPIDVAGEGGRRLADAWSEANEAYRSVAVPGFPNFFMLVGPKQPDRQFFRDPDLRAADRLHPAARRPRALGPMPVPSFAGEVSA